jgi:predicted Fe-Mo cluster-binding NifX family protein
MNICVPVTKNIGLESPVSAHFGSAQAFVIVDTESGACRGIENRDAHHAHGMCRPLASLSGENIHAVVVGGIGAGALTKLQAAGLDVFLADLPTVGDTVAAFREGKLPRATLASACAHHGDGSDANSCHGSSH